jgi:PKD repeat protein
VDGCTIQIVGGSGSCSLVLNTVGRRTLTATYQGNSSFATSSAIETHTVNSPPPPNQPPTAAFTFDCDELDCDFESQSTDSDGRIEDYSWTFGDGESSDDNDPRHEYDANGSYQVTLTVTDDDGATNSTTQTVTVAENPPPNQSPNAAFTESCSGLTCSFNSAGSGDSDGTITYSWTFGDGSSSTEANPSHTYTAGGTYTVRLEVRDDDNATDDEAHQVTVTAPPPPNQSPNAAFTESCSGLTCSFNSAGSGDSDGTITFSWTFGDGGTSTEANPSHTYASGATYTVTLQVTDDDNATDTETRQVTVEAPNEPPQVGFSPPSCTAGEACQFTDGSSDSDGTIASWDWNFRSGGSSTDQNPSPTFPDPGTVEVTLTVTDNDGATGSVTHSVSVAEPPNQTPVAAIGSITCTGMTCSFADDSTDPNGSETIAEWSWVFGDGESSNERNPVHAYSAPDQYDVELKVTDNGGLSGTDSERVTVAVEGGEDGGG